jgi:hypothetical protein
MSVFFFAKLFQADKAHSNSAPRVGACKRGNRVPSHATYCLRGQDAPSPSSVDKRGRGRRANKNGQKGKPAND